jgi:hypothetical protein
MERRQDRGSVAALRAVVLVAEVGGGHMMMRQHDATGAPLLPTGGVVGERSSDIGGAAEA